MPDTATIAVGYDASPEAELALDWAITRARASGANLRIVHVLPGDSQTGTNAPGMNWPAVDPTTMDPADLPAVQRARSELGDGRAVGVVSAGNPAGELIEASQTASMVVMGTRGRGALAAGLLGSTAYAVAAHSACPLVVVRGPKDSTSVPEPGPDRPIVIGIEDLEASRDQLRIAADFAAETNASLKVVRVARPVAFGDWAAGFTLAENDLDNALEESGIKATQECAAQVREWHPNVATEEVHLVGDPARILVDEAADAGLIVVGSRGRGGFKGLLLGSVSHDVIHLAECPVLVVR